MNPEENEYITRSWHEWEIDGRQRYLILVVETSAEMRPGGDGYDPSILEAIRSTAVAKMRAEPGAIDRIRIVPTN